MKNILCFGDSNTWGYIPVTKQRFDYQTRWTGVLQNILGHHYRIIEEGLNGRTTVHNEAERPFRSGVDLLPVLMESHTNLDLLIIMLGTNDLKTKFNSSAMDIAQNIKLLCQLAMNCEYNRTVQLLLISPTHVVTMNEDDSLDFSGAIEESLNFTTYYHQVAKELNIYFFDASQTVNTTTQDGIHWSRQQHTDFAKSLADKIKSILK